MSENQQPCAILKVGLWNGSATDRLGRLLYRTLLKDAIREGIKGGTACGTVEGSRSTRAFRTVESEVLSNQLPVCLEFIDAQHTLETWIPWCQQKIRDCGVIVMETGVIWNTTSRTTKGGNGVQPRPTDQHPSSESDTAYNGLQVQVYTLERNQLNGKPVYQAVAEYLRSKGILWISTTRGMSGFGEEKQVRQRSWWLRKSDVPIVMTVLDRAPRLESCLPGLVEFVGEEAVVVSKPVMWHHPK